MPAIAACIAGAFAAAPSAAAARPFLSGLHTIGPAVSAVPTIGPEKGDVNPYGIATVPRSTGRLVRGDVLVSNFNNAKNQQGTGSTIVESSGKGKAHVFAVVPRPTSTKAVGLTTALVALRSGFVIVGSLPAPGGKPSAMRAGALTVLNANGQVVKTITRGINGPWDMTAVDHGTTAVLFVANVLNGTVAAKGKRVNRGTVVRIALRIPPGHAPEVTSTTVIAAGFTEHTDPSALVVGPTGVALGHNGTLYVADSANDRIGTVPNALTRTRVLGGGGMTLTSAGDLNDPLGLTIAPNGDVVSANGGDGNLVETTPAGMQAATKTLEHNGGGDLFGLTVVHGAGGPSIEFVDDASSGPRANSLVALH
jgi:hypothetical protein